MPRYDALETYLRDQNRTEIEVAVGDIERMVGPLPKAAARPSWWSTHDEGEQAKVRQRAWQKAGYSAELLPAKGRVQFVRHGYRIAWRNENTVWIERENLTEEELARAKSAFHSLIKLVAEATAEACHRLRIEFDMDDPEVAREVFKAALHGLLMSDQPRRPAPRRPRKAEHEPRDQVG